ncbi:MAG: protein kinase [Victivallales bacterium]|nr:protein kinase [Victivallales bacterium]
MAKLIIECENCGENREVDERMAGSTIVCAGCGENIRIPIPDISEGVTIGSFVLEKLLGFGAMGEVWLAQQPTMDRKVALKLLSREFTMDSQFVDRFLKEVRVSAKLDHPNIITAFDAGHDKDIYYLAISYVEGTDLDQRLAELGVIPEKEALRITSEICSALCYAWNDFKLLHRDIKPSNIMLDRKNSAKLMDMGISKMANEEAQLTMTGTVIGTPYYMSPEQGMGERDIDCRSDIYSLGATLYHLVTGSLPFEATTAVGIISKHITEPLPPPQNANPNLSDTCAALLEIMMAKRPDDRQQTWEEVIEDIRLVIGGKMPTSKRRPGPGDSVIMRAVEDKDIPDNAKPTVIMPEPDAPPVVASATQSAPPLQPPLPPAKKSTAVIIAALSAAAVLAIVAAGIFILREKPEAPVSSFLDDDIPEPPRMSEDKPSPRPAPAEIPADPQTDQFLEMWNLASSYAQKNPENFDTAIRNFEEISHAASGTKYKMMANIEIDKLKNARDKAVSEVIASLGEKAEKHKGEQDYMSVAAVYESYDGKLAAETLDDRRRLAEEARAEGKRIAGQKRIEEEDKIRELRKRISATMDLVVDGRMKEAYAALESAGQTHKIPEEISEPLLQIMTISRRVAENFGKEKGNKVVIHTIDGPVEAVVKSVSGANVNIEEKTEKVTAQKRIHFSKLTEEEIIQRADLSPQASAIYRSLLMARAGNLQGAKVAADEIQGDLGAAFTEAMAKKYPNAGRNTADASEIRPTKDGSGGGDRKRPEMHDFPDDDGPFNDVNASRRPPGRGESNPEFDAFQQKLKKVNPAFNADANILGRHGRIEEICFSEGSSVNSEMLKIIAELPHLRMLFLDRTNVSDLSNLAKAKLEHLSLGGCRNIRSIEPLAEMTSLRKLFLHLTQIEDVSPLKGMQLEALDISGTRIDDISALENMPLNELHMMGLRIRDYSVLKTLKKLTRLHPDSLWSQIPGKSGDRPQRPPLGERDQRPKRNF